MGVSGEPAGSAEGMQSFPRWVPLEVCSRQGCAPFPEGKELAEALKAAEVLRGEMSSRGHGELPWHGTGAPPAPALSRLKISPGARAQGG